MPDDVSKRLMVKQLGLQPYEPIWQAMKDFTNARDEQTVDECWLVEHEPVFTQGQAGKPEHILQTSNIPIVQCDRGGQVTYHGPGQAMVYLLVNIKRKSMGVRDFVSLMEDAVITVLAGYGIEAGLKEGAPGVYVQGAKISSLGLRVRRGSTYHGLALNVDMDLSPFLQINPCGYQGLAVTDIKSQLANSAPPKPTLAEVNQRLLETFIRLLQYNDIRTD